MADERFPSTPARGERTPGGRDAGGFRIRLSDNEMQAARALQEAFGLRSTVAVLGFSLRTLAQQLEQGQLDDLIAQHRAQGGGRGPGGREGRGGTEGRRDRSGGEGAGGRGERGPRVNPFARPSKPAIAAAEPEALEPQPSEPEVEPTPDPLSESPDAIAEPTEALPETSEPEPSA
jgi:hypothetical protein